VKKVRFTVWLVIWRTEASLQAKTFSSEKEQESLDLLNGNHLHGTNAVAGAPIHLILVQSCDQVSCARHVSRCSGYERSERFETAPGHQSRAAPTLPGGIRSGSEQAGSPNQSAACYQLVKGRHCKFQLATGRTSAI
jgi:hypothetical protein